VMYNCVAVIDIFQYSNVYVCTACIQYVSQSLDQPGPTKHRIISLYAQMKHDYTLKKWMDDNQIAQQNIDPRKFITFGLLNGIIRRVHKYPLKRSSEPLPPPVIRVFEDSSKSKEVSMEQRIRDVANAVCLAEEFFERLIQDGTHAYDEISTLFGLSYTEVAKLFSLSVNK